MFENDPVVVAVDGLDLGDPDSGVHCMVDGPVKMS